jgi:hypothetical protein
MDGASAEMPASRTLQAPHLGATTSRHTDAPAHICKVRHVESELSGALDGMDTARLRAALPGCATARLTACCLRLDACTAKQRGERERA